MFRRLPPPAAFLLALVMSAPFLPTGGAIVPTVCGPAESIAVALLNNPDYDVVELTQPIADVNVIVPADEVWFSRSPIVITGANSITVFGAVLALVDANGVAPPITMTSPTIELGGTVATSSGAHGADAEPLAGVPGSPTIVMGLAGANGGDISLPGVVNFRLREDSCLATGNGGTGGSVARGCIIGDDDATPDVGWTPPLAQVIGAPGGRGGSILFATTPEFDGDRGIVALGNGGAGGDAEVVGVRYGAAEVAAVGGAGGTSGLALRPASTGGSPIMLDDSMFVAHVSADSGQGGRGGDARADSRPLNVCYVSGAFGGCPFNVSTCLDGMNGRDDHQAADVGCGGQATYHGDDRSDAANGVDGSSSEHIATGHDGQFGGMARLEGNGASALGGPGHDGYRNGGKGGDATATAADGCRGGNGGKGGVSYHFHDYYFGLNSVCVMPADCWADARGGTGGGGGQGSEGGSTGTAGGRGGRCLVSGRHGDGGNVENTSGSGGNGGNGGDGGASHYTTSPSEQGPGGDGGDPGGIGGLLEQSPGAAGNAFPGPNPPTCSAGSGGTVTTNTGHMGLYGDPGTAGGRTA